MYLFKNKIQLGIAVLIISTSLFLYVKKVSKITLSDFKKDKSIANEYINNDSLKNICLNFLVENSNDKYAISRFGKKKMDMTHLDKDYLFNNIDLSISQAEKRLKEGVFTTEQFLQYVLPFRLRYERLENWRELAIKNFKDCYDEDIFIQVKNINTKLKKQFRYNGRDVSNRNLSEMLEDCQGGCYAMSDLATFTMRANGIPIAVDFAKWSNIRGNHQWNVLITKNENHPFMGIETNPSLKNNPNIITQGWKKFAKVYRKTFLKDDFKGSFNPKRVISNVNYIDVTKEYCKNSQDLIINLINENVDNQLFYLCVYEVNGWVPVDFTFGKKHLIKFENVCVNNVFILRKKIGNRLEYYKTPFTFNKDGKVSFLDSKVKISNQLKLHYFNSNDRELIKLYRISMKYEKFIAQKKKILKENFTGKTLKDSLYILYKWDKNKWLELSQSIANDSIVIFDIPAQNSLYKLETNNSKSIENRCFTYDGKHQNWW